MLSKNDRVTYTSHDSHDGFITVLSDIIEKDLLFKVKSAKFYALELDESTDVGVCQNLMIYVRAVIDGRVESHFLTLKRLNHGATAEEIYNAVLEVLEKKDLNLNSLIGIGTDGASVMCGKKSGLVTRLKEANPFIQNQHCAAHRLALASSQACATVPYMVKYQETLNQIYKYYHYSPKNTNTLEHAQLVLEESTNIKFQQVFGTRWMSFKKSVDNIIKCFGALVSALQQDKENKNAKAHGILADITKYKFLAVTYFMSDLLYPLNCLCLSLQKENLLFTDVKFQIEICRAALEALKSKTGPQLQSFYESLPEDIDSVDHFTFKDHFITVSKKQMNEFNSCKEMIIDGVLNNLQARFEKNDPIMNAFNVLVPQNMPENLDEDYGVESLKVLGNYFGADQPVKNGVVPALVKKQDIESEWMMFRHLMYKCKLQTFADFWCMVFKEYPEVYPNMCTLGNISLTCPQTSVNVERGFSRQNLVKNDLRSALTIPNLDRLLMIKIEGPNITDMNWDRCFEEWCARGDRKIFQPKVLDSITKT